MEFFAKMTFLFWANLFFLIGFALCIHFNIFGLRTKSINGFLSLLDLIFPDDKGNINGELKLKIAKSSTIVMYAVFLIFLISVFLSFSLPHSLSADENKYTGPLGDLFNGLITPILTFLTFCSLLITILIQNVQMKSTLQELELTRKEMSQSTKALENQVENFRLQKIDNIFFNLLNHQDKVIQKIYDEKIIEDEIGELNLRFNAAYSESYEIQRKEKFTSFFLINYQILKFINKNSAGESRVLSVEDANYYINILRSLIPQGLLTMILLNCSDDNFPEYKKMLTEAEFFEHLQFEGISSNSILFFVRKYNKIIFGDGVNLNSFVEKRIKLTLDVKNNFAYRELFELFRRHRNLLGDHLYENSSETYYDISRKILRDFNKPIDMEKFFKSIEEPKFLDAFYGGEKHYLFDKIIGLNKPAYALIEKINILVK